MKPPRSTERLVSAAILLLVVGTGCRRHGAKTEIPAAPPRPVAGGALLQEVVISKFPEHPRLWIYTPAEKRKSYPCVFIAPAGSDLASGMRLQEEDQAEHLPYVKAGFMVVAYDVSGDGPVPPQRALFAKRNLGLANGKAAIDYALRSLKVDPIRLYAAGHSSAATLALQLAAEDSRLRGCVAYAPVTDVPAFLGSRFSALASSLPELGKAIRKYSPHANAGALHCPTMLFTAEDDETVPSDTVAAYAEKLSAHNPDVDLVRVTSGGHFDSMIREGIPAGIRWLERDRRPRAKPKP